MLVWSFCAWSGVSGTTETLVIEEPKMDGVFAVALDPPKTDARPVSAGLSALPNPEEVV